MLPNAHCSHDKRMERAFSKRHKCDIREEISIRSIIQGGLKIRVSVVRSRPWAPINTTESKLCESSHNETAAVLDPLDRPIWGVKTIAKVIDTDSAVQPRQTFESAG